MTATWKAARAVYLAPALPRQNSKAANARTVTPTRLIRSLSCSRMRRRHSANTAAAIQAMVRRLAVNHPEMGGWPGAGRASGAPTGSSTTLVRGSGIRSGMAIYRLPVLSVHRAPAGTEPGWSEASAVPWAVTATFYVMRSTVSNGDQKLKGGEQFEAHETQGTGQTESKEEVGKPYRDPASYVDTGYRTKEQQESDPEVDGMPDKNR